MELLADCRGQIQFNPLAIGPEAQGTGLLPQQLQKLIGPQFPVTGGPQPRQGAAQIREFTVQLRSGKIPLASHHFGESLPPLALLRRVGRHQGLAAEPPGPPRGKQLGKGRAQRCRLAIGDPEVEGHGWLAQPHKHLEQLAGTQHRGALILNRQGGSFEGGHQLRAVRQPLKQAIADMDAQAAQMPPQMAPAIAYIKQKMEARVAELEKSGK